MISIGHFWHVTVFREKDGETARCHPQHRPRAGRGVIVQHVLLGIVRVPRSKFGRRVPFDDFSALNAILQIDVNPMAFVTATFTWQGFVSMDVCEHVLAAQFDDPMRWVGRQPVDPVQNLPPHGMNEKTGVASRLFESSKQHKFVLVI